jgi:hypothetical protein
MVFSKQDRVEYSLWLESVIEKEAAKPSNVFTLINIYGLSKDLADNNKQLKRN